MPYNIPIEFVGLNDEEVNHSRKEHGFNRFETKEKNTWLSLIREVLAEPMLLLLIAVTIIYFVLGERAEGFFMLGAIVIISGIAIYQDTRSRKALRAIEKLNAPLSTVVRGSAIIRIETEEIVVGDLCIVSEGNLINADGFIVHSNDFSVNEASLTGESLSVFKDKDSADRRVYSGTVALTGLAVFQVEKVGLSTRIGAIGASMHSIKAGPSPLQKEISQFIKWMSFGGGIVFLMVWSYSFYQTGNLVASLLGGLTIAMSVLPEEIPVAFTTFMALGAWKLMQEGIIVKRSSLVETLGSTTVICTDKTGTITENSMQLSSVYLYSSDTIYESSLFNDPSLAELFEYGMWSSEPVPFDPMEKALHQAYTRYSEIDKRAVFQMVHEYPLGGRPPMMTHIFENAQHVRIIAAKGAPEAILRTSRLTTQEQNKIRKQVKQFALKGYRVLGLSKANFDGVDFPQTQEAFVFDFIGLLAFYDPPKAGISKVFHEIHQAGIQLKVITGDQSETTQAIAKQAGISSVGTVVSGEEVINMPATQLSTSVKNTILFVRMFPEAKLAVVNSLKNNGEIVAMLGDGVNDGPALKAAHIGVAMGNKGTEIAKEAADLVLVDDDLEKLIVGIAAGRRIYANLKKAIQYIISIHIPIILTVALPLFFGWIFPKIFTPVHVIFLELIMGPTCSIVYENEPIEKNTMLQRPRNISETFLNWRELSLSIIQGIVITVGVLLGYQIMVHQGADEASTRAMVFTTLIFANILLSYSNRSFYYSLAETLKYRNRLMPAISLFTLGMLFAILFVQPLADFFHLGRLDLQHLLIAFLLAAASVWWIEVYKLIRRRNTFEIAGY